MNITEANFDGLVGTTHHYSGLAIGNRAATKNAYTVSNPRAAARQGLDKMRALVDLGLVQGVLPPQERPHLPTLRRLGFNGTDAQVLADASAQAPEWLAATASAASMWAANAATVSASADCPDDRVHFTPANLCAQFHRCLETETTARVLRTIFADATHFAHHAPLPATPAFADEGAANHTRFTRALDRPGATLLVYGRAADERPRYPARQSQAASRAIARQHGLATARTVWARQHPAAIAAGVFHNDVIAVGHGDIMFCHARAFADQDRVRRDLEAALGAALNWIEVAETSVSLETAVTTYLFNSQLVTKPDGQRALIVPAECRASKAVWNYLQELCACDTPIDEIHVLDVTQSMHNGGGPACLRLRVPLARAERAVLAPGVFLDEDLYRTLRRWVERHYRDRLTVRDLADPALLDETYGALDELTQILGLGPLYAFQTKEIGNIQ